MKKLLLLAAVISLALPANAQVVTTTTLAQPISQDIVLGPYNVSTTSNPLPTLAIIPNANAELNVLNPTANPLTFSVPELGVNVVIPANAERRISISPAMTANLAPGQQIAYYILDPSGNQIASSYMVNQEVAYLFQQTIVTETTTTTTEEEASEPVTESRSAVRGFW